MKLVFVADLDLYPTIANWVGEAMRIPTDRPIDGIDQSRCMLGQQNKSNREYVVTYVGDKLYAVLVAEHEGALCCH